MLDDIDAAEFRDPVADAPAALAQAHATPEARYEEREAVELALVAALQYLPPKQRAALVLRDVLNFSAKEAAESLGTTVASVNSALQRARKAVEERLPEASEQSTLRSLGDERTSEAVPRFVEAFEGGDVRAIVALLAEDASFATLPYAARRRAKIADVSALRTPQAPGRFRLPSETELAA